MIPEAEKMCATCPALVQNDWRIRGAILRMEMRRHDLTFRETQIAELILDKTFGWQRREVVFPQLSFFTDLTGIRESDVVKVLKRLHARRVIRIVTVKGRHTYSINDDTESWKAMPRVSSATMSKTINLLREHNDMHPMTIEQEATLNFKIRAVTENSAAETGEKPISELLSDDTGDFPDLS